MRNISTDSMNFVRTQSICGEPIKDWHSHVDFWFTSVAHYKVAIFAVDFVASDCRRSDLNTPKRLSHMVGYKAIYKEKK